MEPLIILGVLIALYVLVKWLGRIITNGWISLREPKPDFSSIPQQFIVLDLETTGLRSATHEIIEIGAIRVNRDGNEHDTFQTLVRPIKQIPKKITELTGITQAMVNADGQEIGTALQALKEFVGDLRIVTFNAAFDMGFIHAASQSQGITFQNPVSCALKMARRAWPERSSYRLVDLAKDGGLSLADTHRALGDCQRAMAVYAAAASKLRSAT